ncbi:MAG: hypothetical protein MJ249_02645 [Kiritimatiellae bacterium]|nr:hypothetical protein [Kiritimatiellia bacterium]
MANVYCVYVWSLDELNRFARSWGGQGKIFPLEQAFNLGNVKFRAYTINTESPNMKAMVLLQSDADVQAFSNVLRKNNYQVEEAYTGFRTRLNEKLQACFNVRIDGGDQVYAFVHFGGEQFVAMNEKIRDVVNWDERPFFQCFAISLHGGVRISGLVDENNDPAIPSTLETLGGTLRELYEHYYADRKPPQLPSDERDGGASAVRPPEECSTGGTCGQPPTSQPPEATSGTSKRGGGGYVGDRGGGTSQADGSRIIFENFARWTSIILVVIVALELMAGFVMTWILCFKNVSVMGELCFIMMGMGFVALTICLWGVLGRVGNENRCLTSRVLREFQKRVNECNDEQLKNLMVELLKN